MERTEPPLDRLLTERRRRRDTEAFADLVRPGRRRLAAYLTRLCRD